MATSTTTTTTTILLLLLHIISSAAAGGIIGVNYGRIADNLPDPTKVVQLLKSNGIDRIKLYDTDSTVLKALAGSKISVTVAMPNNLLASAAGGQAFTDEWIKSNVVPYYPSTLIDAIAVGNEVFVDPNNSTGFLVSAMENVYASLQKNKIDINVSSPIALSALATSYPPSNGSFKPELIEPVMKPMLSFLKKTGSYLMVNAYPFFAYGANSDTISLDYALFRDNKGVTDPKSGLTYKSLLEAQIDAVYSAMDALQFHDMNLIVSETGWPSKGDSNEIGAGAENAAQYNGNLVKRVLGTGGGSPLRPNVPLVVYLFALFNEDQKSGPTSERNYGLFYPNEQKVYNVPLSMDTLANSPSAVSNRSKAEVAVAPAAAPAPADGGDVAVSTAGQTWCVANGRVSEEKLQAALDYACGEGGADCRPIQSGDTCYDPNTLEAHASYAFNSYYQKQARASGTCDFGGAAYVVSQPPRFGSCKFPTSN